MTAPPEVGMASIPRMKVASPPAPIAHRFGLLTAATLLEDVEPHALVGVEYQAVCSTEVDSYPLPCEPPRPASPTPKVPKRTFGVVSASPFGVYAADTCLLGRDEYVARSQLRQRFLAGEETAVEKLVFDGSLGNFPNLQRATDIAPNSVNELRGAIGLLELWLSNNYGGIGLIHAPMTVANILQHLNEISVSGPRAGTILGSAWVFGAGYPGTPPVNAEGTPLPDDGSLWLYATPPITVRRSNLVEPGGWHAGTFDVATNQGLLLDERVYVVDWPCGTAAVKVDLKRPGWFTPPTIAEGE
jgi:hypothetical protein